MVTPAFVIRKMCRKRAVLLASLRIFHTLSCSGLSGTISSLFDVIEVHALWILKTLDGIFASRVIPFVVVVYARRLTAVWCACNFFCSLRY